MISAAGTAVAVSGAICGVLPAQAGTVSATQEGDEALFEAAPGEANDLMIIG